MGGADQLLGAADLGTTFSVRRDGDRRHGNRGRACIGRADERRIDAKIAASEARTDTKFAELRRDFAALRGDMKELRGEVREIAAELRAEIRETAAELRAEFPEVAADLRGGMKAMNEKVQGVIALASGLRATVVTTGIASVLALGALLIGVMTFGGQLFGLGLDAIAEQAASRAADEVLSRLPPPTVEVPAIAPPEAASPADPPAAASP